MNIPTAEEFVMKGHLRVEDDEQKDSLAKSHIDFAKLHVEAALKEAFLSSEMRVSENDTNEYPSFVSNYDDGYVTITVSKDSILNAYPLENII